MFRSKKKKVGGRKRREAEAEGDVEATHVSEDVQTSPTAENPASNGPEEAESDLQVLTELRRSRARVSAAAKGAMSFSSKSTSSTSVGSDARAAAASVQAEMGLLSFDDGEGKSAPKRRKMRPNLVASSAAKVEVQVESTGQYSFEMLASLKSEQSVLLPTQQLESIEQEDVEMAVEAENDAAVGRRVANEEQEEQEEEFISLDGGSKPRRTKNRVTFGVYSGSSSLPKTAEVVEEVSPEEDEDEEQSRRWEEELMRRGGHRAPSTSEGKTSRSRDGLPTYPTRRKVACVSLGSVLGKLEKSLESTTFEDERASRELARLEAETALIETTLKQQQEELLVSSEEFEYFQEVEDFAKALSFCLREKVQVIGAKEKNVMDERVDSKRHEELHDVAEEVQFYFGSGRLQRADVVGMDQLDLPAEPSASDCRRSARLQKYQQHFAESYASPSCGPSGGDDLFADAIDEINSLERVYGRFQEWKAKFPEVYKNTYCELAQEKLFAPYVQAELIYWDPLGVADVKTKLGKSWSLDEFAWFQVLHQHSRQTSDDSERGNGPILYQIRDVLLEKVRVAVASYFDPYSSLQSRSLALLLEEINRHGYTPHVESAVLTLVTTAVSSFSREAKRSVLVAIDQNMAATFEDVSAFARYQLERFNALQDNLLTIFVALPRGSIAAAAFRCLLQVLHHLLAYVRHCQDTQKMHLVPIATQVVRQLSGSSYLLQILSDPGQESELKHMMELFAPYLQTAGQ